VGKYTKKKNHLNGIKMAVIYLLIIVIAVMIAVVSQRVKYEKQIAEIYKAHEEEMVALRIELCNEYEGQMNELERYYEYGGDVTEIEREAEFIAKVLYGMARNHSSADQRAVVWCILNRVEHRSHPNTIKEVCEQPKQWIGYSNENPVLEELYDIALTELKTWHNDGHRPMSSDYIYLTWSSKEILLRDTFEENKNTNYWRMR